MNKTSIEWTHRPETRGAAGGMTWNPIRARVRGNRKGGTFCTRISPGCQHCYASTINKRFGNGLEFTVPNLDKVEFFVDERILQEPLKQKNPCTIFVGDMFDLFHEAIPTEFIAEVLRVAGLADQHTFQFLTKRAERMKRVVSLLTDAWGPLPGRLWFGVSVEDKKRADERIPLLLQTPAAVRFLSVEPMLEAINLDGDEDVLAKIIYINERTGHVHALGCGDDNHRELKGECRGVDWVICGGESGQEARPMHPDWARSLRNQCEAANVPFFFKQWGTWQPHPNPPDRNGNYHGGVFLLPSGHLGTQGDWWSGRAQAMDRVGKKHAGALLDGELYRNFPRVATREAVTA